MMKLDSEFSNGVEGNVFLARADARKLFTFLAGFLGEKAEGDKVKVLNTSFDVMHVQFDTGGMVLPPGAYHGFTGNFIVRATGDNTPIGGIL